MQVRELIYREILEYHPHMLADYLAGGRQTNFMYPSAVDSFRRQFAHLEGGNAAHPGLGQVRAARQQESAIELSKQCIPQNPWSRFPGSVLPCHEAGLACP